MGTNAQVDAVLLDFDGVVLDTVNAKADVFRQMLRERIPEFEAPAMEYFHANGGTSRVDKFHWIHSNLVRRPISRAEAEELGAEFARRVENCVLTCRFIDGAQEFLERNFERFPLYVISGVPQPELRHIVEARGLARFFRGVFGSPDKKTQIGERILRENGYRADRVWFVGDATTDRDAAHALGVQFVGLSGPHLDPFLRGDEIMIADLTGLQPILDSPPLSAR